VLDAAQPEAIINPHVSPIEEPTPAEPSSTQTAGTPQVIHNPFVASPHVRKVENLARVE
jgi:hypothetical protein